MPFQIDPKVTTAFPFTPTAKKIICRSVLTCRGLHMFHPRRVIADDVDVLQTGQHFHFPEDLLHKCQQEHPTDELIFGRKTNPPPKKKNYD